jgi:hypothetical protein
MHLLSLNRSAYHDAVARFTVVLAADDGSRHRLTVEGRQLDHPVTFARVAQALTGRSCTSPWAGDHGGWQAHLGELMARNAPEAPQSNAVFGRGRLNESRRQALLACTGLGQATMACEQAGAAAASVPPPEPPPLTFVQKVQRDEAEAARLRHQRLAQFLRLTPLGRDVLAQDGPGGVRP